jgi:hypothetical protein
MTNYPEPSTKDRVPQFQISSNTLILSVQLTKYQYTILDLLQKRIIFLHLKQFITWFLIKIKTT